MAVCPLFSQEGEINSAVAVIEMVAPASFPVDTDTTIENAMGAVEAVKLIAAAVSDIVSTTKSKGATVAGTLILILGGLLTWSPSIGTVLIFTLRFVMLLTPTKIDIVLEKWCVNIEKVLIKAIPNGLTGLKNLKKKA